MANRKKIQFINDNTVDVLRTMSNSKVTYEQQTKEHAIKMFLLGKELIEHPPHIPIRTLGQTLNINYVEISLAKTVAKKMKCDLEEYINYCENTLKTWEWKKIKNSFSTKKMSKTVSQALQFYSYIKAYFENPDLYPERHDIVNQLNMIRKLINRYIPIETKISDEAYLRYSECSCCGSYPPPEEGYKLRIKEGWDNKHILYPICTDCIETNKKPDTALLLKLYSFYALELETAYRNMII